MKESAKRYIIGQMKEPSTWRGIVLILTAAGVKISPDQALAIGTAGVALAGVIGAFLPD